MDKCRTEPSISLSENGRCSLGLYCHSRGCKRLYGGHHCAGYGTTRSPKQADHVGKRSRLKGYVSRNSPAFKCRPRYDPRSLPAGGRRGILRGLYVPNSQTCDPGNVPEVKTDCTEEPVFLARCTRHKSSHLIHGSRSESNVDLLIHFRGERQSCSALEFILGYAMVRLFDGDSRR